MYAIGHILKDIREEKGLLLQSVQEYSGIDQTLLSKIENGKRLPSLDQIQKLSAIYEFDCRKLLIQRESDKILSTIEDPDVAVESLKAAEEKLVYGQRYLSLFQDAIYSKPIALESRRYIGSKAKLTDWIMKTIKDETEGVHTFCDIFAGTAAVSNQAIKRYDKVIINDFLLSNQVIYQGFFAPGKWNKEKLCDILTGYNALVPEELPENYFSENFGGKFYEHNVAKQIGYIRQDIEDLRPELTEKEYNILIATLIYNIDRLANTVGHFDAYIKKPIKPQPLRLRLIDAQTFDNVEIHREDSNLLARKIKADVVYIDPPYNSRQYCEAYHLYENLIRWEKPELNGVAMKFPQKDKKSDYCTMKAADSFEDLIKNIQAHYIVLSYNNMGNKGNGRSNAKMSDEDIMRILSSKGRVKIFAKNHKAFSTGISNIENNQERLFICASNN